MSDLSVDLGSGGAKSPSAAAPDKAAPKGWRARIERSLGWRAVAAITLLGFIGVGLYFNRYEGAFPNLFFVWSCTLLVAAAIIFVTGRILPAAILVPAMIAIVDQASVEKHRTMDMVVHAYDIIFYLTSPSTLKFLFAEYRTSITLLFAALGGLCIVTWLAHKADATRIDRRYSAAGLMLLAIAVAVAANVKGPRRNTQPYWEDLVISSFYSSWAETVETLFRGSLIEAASSSNGATPFAVPASCEAKGKLPHLILIHQESVVPPEYFPEISYDKAVDSLFRSGDGQLHKMRVETYGGASWLTEFSILAGVSTYSFGGMRPFVQSLMAGKVRDTLPERLATCGYRNTVFYPLNRNFVSNAKFYTAVGMPEIYDMHDQGAKVGNERDRFYYTNALNLMEKHIKESDKPFFSFVITMATHGPYNNAYMPEENVPGGGPGTNPEMNEYLRRLSMARIDYDAFREELKRRFPNEQIVVVRYGDHHPIATRSYLGQGGVTAAEDVSLAMDSLGYVTYYTVETMNYQPPALPAIDVVDVPYLSTLILEQVGIPLTGSYGERRRLMTACNGRYYGCNEKSSILSFHRRLLDSGLMDGR